MGRHCTMSPDGYWGSCCKKHDDGYSDHRKSKKIRLSLDEELRDCMISMGGVAKFLAPLYYWFVRKFGVRFYIYKEIKRIRHEKGVKNINSL